MRVVAAVAVKDEAELIERTIRHLRGIDVDVIVVFDLESTDGTTEILRHESTEHDLRLIRFSDELGQQAWSDRVLQAVRETRADWVIFLDADEYPIPSSGSLHDRLAREKSDVLRVDRFNVPLGPHGPTFPELPVPDRYDDVEMIVEPISQFWSHLDASPETPWIKSRVAPRVIARPDLIAHLPLGAHDVRPVDGTSVKRSVGTDLVVAHLPFTTRDRFIRKVGNVRSLLRRHDDLFGERLGRHWRRWVTMAEQGRLDEEFDRMIFDAQELAELREQGVVRSAAELFRARLASPAA